MSGTNTVTITVNGTSYDSLTDWGLAIGNNNCVGDPVAVENLIEVPGLNKVIDLSEVFGSMNYQSRPITINFGAVSSDWPGKLMNLRNLLHGRVIKLTFADDSSYYWTGRCYIQEFDRFRGLGTFTLSVPKAEPFKYKNAYSTKSVAATTAEQTVAITNSGVKTVFPEVYSENDVVITCDGTSVSFSGSDSWQTSIGLKLVPGANSLKVKVTETAGTVQFRWREASL